MPAIATPPHLDDLPHKDDKPLFNQVCIVGLGLIGASLTQAIYDNHLATKIVAVDTHKPSIEAALQVGVISAGASTLDEVVQGCDCIIIAVPVKAVKAVIQGIKQALDNELIAHDCIITDVSSTKRSVIDSAIAVFGSLDAVPMGFVPAHPIAGAENSGFFARRGDLFVNHNVIMCPIERDKLTQGTVDADSHQQASDSDLGGSERVNNDSAYAISKVKKLWQSVGAQVMQMEASYHDEVLAYTSHLPHLLAFNLVEQLADNDDNMDIFRYAAGGFRDFTRIAASDPIMWRDIFFANKVALIEALDGYSTYLQRVRELIVNEQSTELIGMLSRAQSARRHFGHMLNSTPYTHPNYSLDLQLDTSTSASVSMSNPSVTKTMAETMTATASYVITPRSTIKGTIRVPGDKSISHRSIMFGSLACGITRVTGFLEGEDALATLQAFRDMGVVIEGPDNGVVVIHGVGINGLKPSRTPLYMGNSGTSMRLLAGILAAQPFDSVMTGDVSLSKRPMERVANPLRQMGASLQTTGAKGTAPISITGSDKRGSHLQGITYSMPVASAQVKSCLLLAGLWAQGTTTIIQPKITRDHTERMLSAFGYEVVVEGDNGNIISLKGGGRLDACDIDVPADISSAAFFMVAAAIAEHGEITIIQVGINPTRTGVIDILKLMGADITLSNKGQVGAEPVADITIKASNLKGIDIPEHLVPLAIDEFPVLFVAASCATGRTVLTGASELRVKESDRIAVMAEGLSTLGVHCIVTDDGMIIEGLGNQNSNNINEYTPNWQPVFNGGKVSSHHDHRIAMSFAIASIRARDTIIIEGTETVNTSFPKFAALANSVGMNIAIRSN